MTSDQARNLLLTVLELVELCTQYDLEYGLNAPTLKSPQEAWDLQESIFDKQREIARLLGDDAIANGRQMGGDVYSGHLNSGRANDIAKRVIDIFGMCLKAEHQLVNRPPDNIRNWLHTLALQLDPKAVKERHNTS